MSRFRCLALIGTILLFVSCGQQDGRQELFDTVWQTVYDTYPDSTFGSRDWVGLGERYRAQLPSVENDDEFIDLLNEMLFELNVSHAIVGHLSHVMQKASPYMFMSGSPEIDIRILNDHVVVTKVSATSRAKWSTMLPGCVLQAINDVEISDIISAAPIYPPHNDRYQRFLQTEEVLRHLYGDVGSSVRITYLTIDGHLDSVEIVRAARDNPIILSPEFPSVYLEVDSKMLPGDLSYIRFNAFQPENPEAILSAIDSVASAKALVIDLRGNNGGSLEAQRTIAARFFDSTTIGIIAQSRSAVDTLVYHGNKNAMSVPIAILVDEVSISGAELFPASLQSLGRATVVGSRTPGAVMGGYLEFLTDSLVLVHPTLAIRTDRGVDLEGVGVKPDILVPLDRALLARGIDNQLEAALTFLVNELQADSH